MRSDFSLKKYVQVATRTIRKKRRIGTNLSASLEDRTGDPAQYLQAATIRTRRIEINLNASLRNNRSGCNKKRGCPARLNSLYLDKKNGFQTGRSQRASSTQDMEKSEKQPCLLEEGEMR